MRMKRSHLASLDQVRITRESDAAVIEYADPTVATTHFTLGTDVQVMTDQEILDRFNEYIQVRDQAMAEYEHVPVEIPPGHPQIEYFARSNQWTPRGDVLRCVISDGGPDNEPIIYKDDQELSWDEFGRLLTTHAGWGMRVTFVPDDRVHENTEIEVREPKERKRPGRRR